MKKVVVLKEQTVINGVSRDRGEVVVVDSSFPNEKIRRVIKIIKNGNTK